MGGPGQRPDPALTMPVHAMIARSRAGALAALVLLAGCQAVPPPRATPAPPPAPPTPTPIPMPVTQSNLSWEEAPVVAGAWVYASGERQKAASFTIGGTEDRVSIGCDVATRQVRLTMGAGSLESSRTVTIRTSFGALSRSGLPPIGQSAASLVVTFPANDPALDQIAYSRGRISIEVPGSRRLILPVWAEISRVIEDCRN